ncbi:MAG: ATP-dependent helicase RhlE [Cyanobacteriota bacterium]|jgi:ATP-dependent RNA helicase RhlE
MSFSDLGLSPDIVRAVTACGYSVPTPIQQQAIPVVLEGKDLLAGAQTGTGKTAGFTLPILHRLSQSRPTQAAASPSPKPQPKPVQSGKPQPRPQPTRSPSHSPVRALILTPTRELAAQVEDSVQTYGKYLDIESMTIFGGVNINPQIRRLKGRVDILVATPGRLIDHINQGTVDLSKIEILVLDEADRMLDMGFIRDIRRILAVLPQSRQNLLFSATFSDEIRDLAGKLLHQPVSVEVARRNTSAERINQQIYRVSRSYKAALLTHLIEQHNWYQVLVFTRTKHGADRLAKQLTQKSIPALAIHGNKSQAARTKTLAKFKEGEVQVLVATDIAARGIDISDLPQVVNFDLPDVAEDYVHRIGRTGRAGADGAALSLVSDDEIKLLKAIERLINRSLPQEIISGFEPGPEPEPAPRDQRSRGSSRSQSTPPPRPGNRNRPSRPGSHSDSPRHDTSRPKRSGDSRRR